MSEAQITAVAERLIAGWRSGTRQSREGLALPDVEAAYAVQRQVADAMGWFAKSRPTAWKIGGAPAGLISTAPVPAEAIHASGWQVPAGYVSGFGIEGELAIRLGRDLSDTPDIAEMLAAIDAWLPCIELCDTRLEDGASADPLLRLADQQLNRALILGEPIRLDTPTAWSLQSATLRIDGQIILTDSGSHPFINPLSSLPWLAQHAAAQGTQLRAGDLIATGSWTGIHWAAAHQKVLVEFPGFGSVQLLTPTE